MLLKDKKILVIDDSPDMRLVLRKIVSGAEAKFYESENIASGLEATLDIGPDIILLDLNLNGKDGVDFLKAKAQISAIKRIPTIVVSGKRDSGSVYRAISHGAVDYLVKPINIQILLSKIKKHINDKTFGTYRFKETDFTDVSIGLPAKVTSLVPFELTIQSPAKLIPNVNIRVKSETLDSLGFSNFRFKTSNFQPMYMRSSTFLNRIQFVGITNEQGKQIRKTLKGLKGQK